VQAQAFYFEALKNILHVDGHPSLEPRQRGFSLRKESIGQSFVGTLRLPRK
jgi:hypothetical protein